MSQAGDLQFRDEALFERARKGDVVAFAILVHQHQESVYRIVRNLCQSPRDLESVLQDVFLEAHRGMAPSRDHSFGTFIYRIAIDVACARAQQCAAIASHEPPGDDKQPAAAAAWPELSDALIERLELVERIQHLLGRVDKMTRAAFVLHEVELLTAEDAAVVLRTSPALVRRTVHQALLMLRSELARLFRELASAQGTA